MAYVTEQEYNEWMENLKKLNYTIELAHLKSMIRDLSNNQRLKFNLREGPLYKKSPAEVSDMLEELGWESDESSSNGWEQDTWIPFAHEAYDFCLSLAYSGYYWTMELYRSDIDD